MSMAKANSLARCVTYAPDAWRMLNGVFCVYKPVDATLGLVVHSIRLNLCKDLNKMMVRPPSNMVKIEGSSNAALTVTNVLNLADTPQVLGPRYQENDIRFEVYPDMSTLASGVCLIGINKGRNELNAIKENSILRKYEITGSFGMATTTSFEFGKVYERATYEHIKRRYVDKILASIQAKHQKEMFKASGVHIQSQAAYELATGGLIRSADKKIPIIYSLKCTELNLPDFKFEILSVNEDQNYLADLVHTIGWHLKSAAVCKKIRCVQFGKFGVDIALLRKHWTLQNILNNMSVCASLVSDSVITSASNLEPI